MRKHPIILGLCLLLLVGLFFLLLAVLGGGFFGKRNLSWGEHVGVVTVEGIIKNSREIIKQIDSFGKDSSVRAIVVRIDSPGGGVTASQEIHDAILAVKKK
ncbi:MAG: signal peptide peptidase SppA, partial [Syntrophus sp. (in: bacteria)]|nr:signal peptide peptidase SppA [Syntrophus sp. (in: bacteria)]